MYFLPESPRWLVQKDRKEEALRVLATVHAKGDENDPYVQAELREISAKIAYEKLHPSPSYWSLLFGEERRRMWIGIGVVSLCYPWKFIRSGLSFLTLNSNSGNR
jgi:hypothetical protein